MNFKEKVLELLRSSVSKYLTEQQIYQKLGGKSVFEKTAIRKVLDELKENGDLIFDACAKKWVLTEFSGLLRGKMQGTAKSFAFFLPEDGSEDLFVAEKNLNGALHGDIVLVKPVGYRGRTEGQVVKVLDHTVTELVGTVHKKGASAFVSPDDRRFKSDVFVAEAAELKNGQKVLVQIEKWQKEDLCPEGKVLQIIGMPSQKGTDVLSIALSHGLHSEFPQSALTQAKAIPQEVRKGDLKGRKDLRSKKTFTIDGASARDFDDAVSLEEQPDGTLLLGVHIADVSHYVRQGTPIDREAFQRATSAYFPDLVLPMLPVELSNGICSLNPGVDRLTMSVLLKLTPSGKVVDYEVCKSVIHSNHRFTYDEVATLLKGDKALQTKYADVKNELFVMADLAQVLEQKRNEKGAMEFDSHEVEFVLDEHGAVEEIVPVQRTVAHKMIEEFMILANVTVAEFAAHLEYPFVYRVHERPAPEKIHTLRAFAGNLGLTLKESDESIHSSSLKALLDAAENTPYCAVLHKAVLRSMQKAKYSTNNIGHFGLSSECYCHFTSPIRRYPDLVVHRILKMILDGAETDRLPQLETYAEKVATQSTAMEMKTDDAEYEADDLKKAEYAERLLGTEQTAVVSGVTEFGIFAELENTVEGLIRIENLPGTAYVYDASKYEVRNSVHAYRLGDTIRVVVAGVDLAARKVEFLPAEGAVPRGKSGFANGRGKNFSEKSGKKKYETSPAQRDADARPKRVRQEEKPLKQRKPHRAAARRGAQEEKRNETDSNK